jgi:hypothetical protein
VKIVVLGGYGNFGAVIAEQLAADRAFEVVVAGRDAAKAAACAERIGARACAIDSNDPCLVERLRTYSADLVISTAGPFQGQDYRVAHAALSSGAHYIDIADGRAFVCGIVSLDRPAREARRLVVSGASSVPALSSAVVDHLARDFQALKTIDVGISASERAPGRATIEAVLGYCGKPFSQWRGGRWVAAHGWQRMRRHEFTHPPMRRWLADCDVPDLELLPARHPGVSDVRFVAGVELLVAQAGLWLLSWAVRSGMVRDASRHSVPLARAAHLLERFGTGRSAMFVRVAGIGSDGLPRERTWELRARNNEGIRVPCMAAVALARKLTRGVLPLGATPCVGLISLEEYLLELRGCTIEAYECSHPEGAG